MLTTKEYAALKGISLTYAQKLCQRGKIAGAVKVGRDWMIPNTAKRKRK